MTPFPEDNSQSIDRFLGSAVCSLNETFFSGSGVGGLDLLVLGPERATRGGAGPIRSANDDEPDLGVLAPGRGGSPYVV
jgi:hypothetical protein